MKQILLSQNKIAMVDDEDFENLNQFNWTAKENCISLQTGIITYYAVRQKRNAQGKRYFVYMHREILKLKPYKEDKIQVDHKNHNGLDNQKENLRLATNSLNQANKRIKNKLGYRGVQISSSGKSFSYSIRIDGRIVRFSNKYKTAKEAAIGYDIKAKEIYGDFAILNFG